MFIPKNNPDHNTLKQWTIFFLAKTEKQLSVFLQTRFLTNQMAQGCFQKLFVFKFSIHFLDVAKCASKLMKVPMLGWSL